MLSTIHDTTVVNRGRKDMKTNMEIKKHYAVVQYSKFIKGIDRGRPVPELLLSSEENCKMVNKVVLYLLNCVLCNTFCVQDTKYKQSNYKNFLHEVGRSWISEFQNRSDSSFDGQLPERGA
jgi:hypothetical protein